MRFSQYYFLFSLTMLWSSIIANIEQVLLRFSPQLSRSLEIVSRENNECIGKMDYTDHTHSEKPYRSLDWFWIKKDQRKSGKGTHSLRLFEKQGIEDGFAIFQLIAEDDMVEYYQKRGYTLICKQRGLMRKEYPKIC